MLFRKYLAFIESTNPWIGACILTWWTDRLFVELGHRSSDTVLCTHSDIQYVHMHQYLTIFACTAQIIYSIRERTAQFQREAQIMGIVDIPCQWPIYICCTVICVAWTITIVCLIDVSPWLCIGTFVQYRASIALMATLITMCTIPIEAKIWDTQLQQALLHETGPIDI